MKIINSRAVQEEWKADLVADVTAIYEWTGETPTLAIIQVEGDKASDSYIRSKVRLAEQIGIGVNHYYLAQDTDDELIMELIEDLNANPEINGIIVQLPLPKHLNERQILETISPIKDVDGLTSLQKGYLQSVKKFSLPPCTAYGIVKLLKSITDLKGKDVTIVNRSQLIGLPLVQLLQEQDATVTLCHSKTKNLYDHIQYADIVITGVGQADFLRTYDFMPGQIIIDCGMNIKDGKLVGDIHMSSNIDIDIQIASGKGHTGPMTVLALMQNVIAAYDIQEKYFKEDM